MCFAQDDLILKAMKDEIERSKQLKIVSLDAPYFIEYRVEDESLFGAAATLGALLGANQSATRIPTVKVRVGDYNFDNTDHIFSDAYAGSRYDPGQLPLDNDYLALRHVFWLATDRAYKTAEDAIARKRSSLKNINVNEQLPDFSKVGPVTDVLPIHRTPVNETLWKDRVVKLSAIFSGYPQVIASGVELQESQSTDYLVNSEGTVLRTPEDLAYVRVRAYALTPDGAQVQDAEVFQAFEVNGLPSETDLRRGVTEVADNVTALAQAPLGEGYSGPVLFEARAAAQLFGQLLGDNLKITRKPISDPGRPAPYRPSELENRLGSRILPEWMDVVDDPAQTEWRGHTLLGHYLFDLEGVAPKPLPIVDKGVLKNFFLTRTPMLKGVVGSNGHARMPGAFGAKEAGMGNLFIRATQTMSAPDLKKKLMELCKQRNKPYGMLVRKLDYPSSASPDEFRRMAAAMAQSSGNTRPVSMPLLVYRIYADGRQELVRSLRFRGLSTRSLKDIIAASDENYVFNFIDSNAPFALMGAGTFITTSSVIAPSILFDELEFEPVQDDVPKPPIVPPPPLGGTTADRMQDTGGKLQQASEPPRKTSPSASCRLAPAA
ncbi:MAG TPA: metallopeptidase TldD-related protein [Bryobacteraceae bacterium]|nr:metallopeptidase TldD-related protein [Bryobacteraceae bacterium]